MPEGLQVSLEFPEQRGMTRSSSGRAAAFHQICFPYSGCLFSWLLIEENSTCPFILVSSLKLQESLFLKPLSKECLMKDPKQEDRAPVSLTETGGRWQ